MNIKQIFDRHNVKYRESGKNVKRGNINVCCPFCKDDEGFHLGIDPASKKWGCWRNLTHKGRGYRKLFQKLLKLSTQQIIELCEEKYYHTDDDFKKLSEKLFINKKIPMVKKQLSLLKEFIPIQFNINDKFYNYLKNRDFNYSDILKIINHYKLMGCLVGDYKFRIIIPIYLNEQLATWTSRSIREDEDLRYLTLSEEKAIININRTLFDYDNIIQGGNILFITEGPFDVMKMFTLLNPKNKVTCIFTKNITNQLFLLTNLSVLYNKLVVILDKGENFFTIKRQMEHISNLSAIQFPFNDIKDVGEFTAYHMNKVMEIVDNLP